MKTAIAGNGYVGLDNAMLLAQYNEVVALDSVPENVSRLAETKYFNFRSIEAVTEDRIAIDPKAVMVIKSTVSVGYTVMQRPHGKSFHTQNVQLEADSSDTSA